MLRAQKITFQEMREFGVVVCGDFHCSHSTVLDADRWRDHVWLSDAEPQFVRWACSKQGSGRY
jgi:hypothetical protein